MSSRLSHPSAPTERSLNSLINRYFHRAVQLRQNEKNKSYQIAQPVVEQILKEMSQSGFFKAEPVCIGSHFQGLKVGKADELDYSVQLEGFDNTPFVLVPHKDRFYQLDRPVDNTVPSDARVVRSTIPLPPPPKGYTLVSDKNFQAKKPQLCWDADVIPFYARRKLKEELTAAIQRLSLQDTVKQSRWIHGPAITFTIKQTGHHPISVDFAPMINIPTEGWYTGLGIQWPHRGARWPPRDKVEIIRNIGDRPVAKKNFYWQRSYALCERALVEGIDADGGCRKKAHRVMKKFNEVFWCDTTKKVISSYMLKNILFWECENFPDSTDWAQDQLTIRVKSMTSQLLDYVSRQQLPLFMNPEVNLLADRKQSEAHELEIAADKIQDFLSNMEKKLTSALDEE